MPALPRDPSDRRCAVSRSIRSVRHHAASRHKCCLRHCGRASKYHSEEVMVLINYLVTGRRSL